MAKIRATPGQKLTVTHGDIINVKTDLDFRGPGGQFSFWGSIVSGNNILCSGWEVVGFTTTSDWVTYHPAVDVPVIDSLLPGLYDLWCYIGEYPNVKAVAYNAIEIVPDHNFSEFAIIQYKKQGGSYVNAGTTLKVQQGDTLTVKSRVNYQGMGIPSTIYWGNLGTGNTAGISSYTPLGFSASNEPVTYYPAIDIPIPTDIAPGTYDIWCFFEDYPEAGTPRVTGVISVEAAPSQFELIQDTVYPFAYIYDGPAQVVTTEYLTEPFTPAAWSAQNFADKLEEEIRANGARIIQVKVWVDVSPLLWRTFKVEVTATPLSEGISIQSHATGTPKTDVERLMEHYHISEKQARALLDRYPVDVLLPERGTGLVKNNIQAIGAIPIFVQIVIVALAFIGVVVAITLAVKEISSVIQHRTGLHEAKQSWSKETMIQCIHDTEEHYNLTPTPDSTLQAMSEYDVREYLDALFDAENAGSSMTVFLLGAGAALLAAIIAGRAIKSQK